MDSELPLCPACEGTGKASEGYQMRWCPWFPIDHEPLPPPVRTHVAQSYQPIVYSQFGFDQATRAGLDARYVPHGVDLATFCPGDKDAAREAIGWPKDRYVVGMVAANKESAGMHRKALQQQMEAFWLFHQKHPDSLLYMHTLSGGGPTGGGQFNIIEYAEHLGLKADHFSMPDPYAVMMGFPDSYLVNAYRAMDTLLSCSMGEGFGVPILEAQACGTPAIVGDWTSMPELCWDGAKLPKSEALKIWSPMGAYQYLPRVEAMAEALELQWQRGKRNRRPPEAENYDADLITKTHWRGVLDELSDRLEIERAVPPIQKPQASSNGHMPNRAERRQLARVK